MSDLSNIHGLYAIFFSYFRKKRMLNFLCQFAPSQQTRILDIGGTTYNWEIVECNAQITLVNITVPLNQNKDLKRNYICAVGDGTQLSYPDAVFDIGFSNSVIEHLGTYELQAKFADEIRRVGRSIWVQTPAKGFFVEPHLITPFIHFLPKRVQRRLLRNFTIWGWFQRPTQEKVDQFLAEIRLLTYDEMKALFPDCEVYVERFLGMPKAYIAVRER
jgi:hypothetical protein